MKKTVSLLLAVVSTMFLFAGATQAAEKFDQLAESPTRARTGDSVELSSGPCIVQPDET
jgi:hypothetical protein